MARLLLLLCLTIAMVVGENRKLNVKNLLMELKALRDGDLCTNTCGDKAGLPWSGDDTCEDGGPKSANRLCKLGTDCADCGIRTNKDRELLEADVLCTNTCGENAGFPWSGDGTCEDGGPKSSNRLCKFGTDCADCGNRYKKDLDEFQLRDHEDELSPEVIELARILLEDKKK